jgi:PAS domain S-box-containing protein
LETSLEVNGLIYWLKWIVRTIFLDGEKEKEYQLVGVDFTPLKEAELKLKAQNVKLDAIFNNSITGIGVLDMKGNFNFVNKRMVELLGLTSEYEIKGSNFKAFIVEDSDESGQSFLLPIFEQSQPFINTVSLVKRVDGSSFWGNWYFGPLVDINGKVVEVVAIMTDFTSRQALEQRLRDNEDRLLKLNDTKDRFFSIIAHDIKNPFSAIIGLTSVLQSSLDSFTQEEIKVFIDQIADAGEKTYKLLDDLLTWSRMQLGQLYFNPVLSKPALMVNRVTDQLKIVALRKGINLQNNVGPSVKLLVDIPMMELAIRNIIHNAIKFTEPGGIIQVVSSLEDTRFPNKVVISVIDTGVGMTAETIKSLFVLDKPTTTLGTSQEIGTGLGLSLSKEMIEKNNGRIFVFSEPDKGSEFTFVFEIPQQLAEYN